jgi:DNA-binding transcriptional LysR family regulator
VGREKSFTRAAAKLGVSTSALSQTIRNLEGRLGLRLLTRTTRSVAVTEAGARLLRTVETGFEAIEGDLRTLSEFRDRPAGTVRITAGEHPAIAVLQPALKQILGQHPEVNVEIIVDYGLTDIVTEGFDAGVRFGEQLAQDMIAVRISPDIRMAVVGSPGYFDTHPLPLAPQDLTAHNCINMRLPTYGGIFPWEFEKGSREVKVRVTGQTVVNNIALRLSSAMDGLGLAYLPEDQALPHIRAGELVRVLEDWCPPFAGYHLYYPSRRQRSTAFNVVIEALRYRERQVGGARKSRSTFGAK